MTLTKLVADVSGRGGDLLPSCVPGGPGKPGRHSRCPRKDAQIYLSIHQETSNYLSTLPTPAHTTDSGPEDCTIQTDGRRQDGPIMADRDRLGVVCLYNNVL